jgi:hypothetical protein
MYLVKASTTESRCTARLPPVVWRIKPFVSPSLPAAFPSSLS